MQGSSLLLEWRGRQSEAVGAGGPTALKPGGADWRLLTVYQLGAVRPVHEVVLERVLPRMVGANGRDGRLVDGRGLLLRGGLGHGDEEVCVGGALVML